MLILYAASCFMLMSVAAAAARTSVPSCRGRVRNAELRPWKDEKVKPLAPQRQLASTCRGEFRLKRLLRSASEEDVFKFKM